MQFDQHRREFISLLGGVAGHGARAGGGSARAIFKMRLKMVNRV